MTKFRQLGTTAIIALVALRIGIGMHFFMEGAVKFQDPKPYSSYFLLASKGPFAPLFRGMVWDADGVARLDMEQSLQIWDHYRQQAIEHYGLRDDQVEESKQIFDTRKGQLEWWLTSNESDIAEYQLGLKRRNEYWKQKDRMQVASLRGQVDTIEAELSTKRSELIGPINRIWSGYVADLKHLGDASQSLPIPKPGRQLMDSELIDVIIRYFDVAVGALMIVGLFTRLASAAGAVFLLSIVASQWPGAAGAVTVWPQFIEMLAMIVLAAVGAGRFAGLDFVVGSACRWCCPPKQGTEA